ncbi:hypothetical protein E2C01_101381 [Portunus trituberculatus]|uniref:Uncharacterized protein n=1 Tax=Portunus trituberculatus TaxID=210409 RepID=A0A5B7KKB7_PORTR|nr:hypothetical protein [Portunus trituberculatus]
MGHKKHTRKHRGRGVEIKVRILFSDFIANLIELFPARPGLREEEEAEEEEKEEEGVWRRRKGDQEKIQRRNAKRKLKPTRIGKYKVLNPLGKGFEMFCVRDPVVFMGFDVAMACF